MICNFLLFHYNIGMEQVYFYKRIPAKWLTEKIDVIEVYKTYALNNELPVYNKESKLDGDYFMVAKENGEVELKGQDFTYDEMIAKILFTLFDGKIVTASKRMIDGYINAGKAKQLGDYLVSAMEEDFGVEIKDLNQGGKVIPVIRCFRKNVMNMEVGTFIFDESNEMHVAFATLRKALRYVAETLVENR